jgi:hypothetical protein
VSRLLSWSRAVLLSLRWRMTLAGGQLLLLLDSEPSGGLLVLVDLLVVGDMPATLRWRQGLRLTVADGSASAVPIDGSLPDGLAVSLRRARRRRASRLLLLLWLSTDHDAVLLIYTMLDTARVSRESGVRRSGRTWT